MRNKNRIAPIIKKLETAWNEVPNWRLGQLLSNLQGLGRQDVFHTQDEDWETFLDNFLQDIDDTKNK